MKIATLAASLLVFSLAPAFSATVIYSVSMSGDQEVPGPGDLDGIATGMISLNDTTGEISWDFAYANIAAPTAMHIHTGAVGVGGGIFIGLGVVTSGGPGTLIDSFTVDAGDLGLVAAVNADPAGYYVNIHNVDFSGGAVRGQLGNVIPEPSVALLGGLAGVLLLSRRRRASV